MNISRFLENVFVRQDGSFSQLGYLASPKTLTSKISYLLLYVLPGAMIYLCINIEPIYMGIVYPFGISSDCFQLSVLIFVMCGWYVLSPFLLLRIIDKLTIRQSLAYLSMDHFDVRGGIYLQVVFFLTFALLIIPYMEYIFDPIHILLNSIPAFSEPSHSFFYSELGSYSTPALLHVALFMGNFFGEELYFRGFLQRKTAFLGKHNIWINGALFSISHFSQITTMWSLIIPCMAFPLIMSWRKNLWVVVIFHFLLNLVWAPGFGAIVGFLIFTFLK